MGNVEQPDYNTNNLNNFENKSNNIKQNSFNDDCRLAAIFHLVVFANFLIPLLITGIIILIIIKASRNNFSDFLTQQWREAINFNISIIAYGLIFSILCIMLIGVPLLFLLLVYSFVMPIVAAIKTLDGQPYRYPFIFRLI
jgi:uncharacterized Tic20 family protein